MPEEIKNGATVTSLKMDYRCLKCGTELSEDIPQTNNLVKWKEGKRFCKYCGTPHTIVIRIEQMSLPEAVTKLCETVDELDKVVEKMHEAETDASDDIQSSEGTTGPATDAPKDTHSKGSTSQ